MAGYGTRQGWNQRGALTPREMMQEIRKQHTRVDNELRTLLDILGPTEFLKWLNAQEGDSLAELQAKALAKLEEVRNAVS